MGEVSLSIKDPCDPRKEGQEIIGDIRQMYSEIGSLLPDKVTIYVDLIEALRDHVEKAHKLGFVRHHALECEAYHVAIGSTAILDRIKAIDVEDANFSVYEKVKELYRELTGKEFTRKKKISK